MRTRWTRTTKAARRAEVYDLARFGRRAEEGAREVAMEIATSQAELEQLEEMIDGIERDNDLARAARE